MLRALLLKMSSSGAKTDGLGDFMKTLTVLPKLIVLDIDYTVWPLHVDWTVSPPFKSDGNGGAIDSTGQKIQLFKDVRPIIHHCKEYNIILAAASRTTDPPASRQLLGVLQIEKEFHHLEIFPDQKFNHFRNIQKASGVQYKDMLFFDDEYHNIRDIKTLGVTCLYIEDEDGLTIPRLKKGLEQFSKNNTS